MSKAKGPKCDPQCGSLSQIGKVRPGKAALPPTPKKGTASTMYVKGK